MIEKLDIKDYENKEQLVWFGVINKLNQLVDAVNGILDYAPLEMAMKAEKPNTDIGELAFLSKENSDLQDELERTRKALDVAVDAIKTIKYSKKSDAINLRHKANKALIEIYKIKDQTALEQKDE